jgi:hypothetical protein
MTKTFEMQSTQTDVYSMILGFVGGSYTLLTGPPQPILATIIGSGLVALMLSGCSWLGKTLAAMGYKYAVKKYKNYKTKN